MFCMVCMPVTELLLFKTNPEFSTILVDEIETPEDELSFNEFEFDPLVHDNDLLPALPVYIKDTFPIELSLTKKWHHFTNILFNLRESDIWQPPRLS